MRPLNAVGILVVVLAGLAYAAPEAPFPKDDQTILLLHFDGPGADADFAAGEAKAQVEGPLEFEEGTAGKALKFGKTQIKFTAAKNINPFKGTVEFWVMDLDFERSSWTDQRIIFSMHGYGKEAEEGRSYLLRCLLSRNWVGVQIHVHGQNVAKDPGTHLMIEESLPTGSWQYCAVGWDFETGDIAVRVGEEIRRQKLKPEDTAAIRKLIEAVPTTSDLTIGQRSYVALDETRFSNILRPEVFAETARQEKEPLSGYGGGANAEYVPTRNVVTPHVPWARPYYRGATKVLVVENWMRLREVVELAQRMDIEYDVVPLKTDGRSRERFGTMAPYEHDMILRKLAAKPEVLVLGGLSSKWFPDDVWQAITNSVANGTGLVWPGLDPEEPRVKELFQTTASVEGFLSSGPPLGMMVLPSGPPKQALPVATFGKGRVAGMLYENQTHRRYAAIIPSMYLGDEEYHFALLSRLVIWAAGKTPDVLIQARGDSDQIPAAKAGHPVTAVIRSNRDQTFKGTLRFAVRDTSVAWRPFRREKLGNVQTGRYSYPERAAEVRETTIAPGENKIEFTMPALPQGYYSADVHLSDEQNRAIDWDSAWVSTKASPAITNLTFEANTCEHGGTMPAAVFLDGDAAGVTLEWELRDTHDRVLARGAQPATEARLTIPVQNPLTRGLWLHVKLRRGEALLQEVKNSFLVRLHRTNPFPYLMYGGVGFLLDELGTTGHVTGTDDRTDAMIADYDRDVFYWLDTPGLYPFEDDGAIEKTCLTDPATRQKAEEYFAKRGDAIRRQEPIAALIVDEWSYMSHDWAQRKEQLCHSPTCLAGFRQFLKKEYGDLKSLNREWETDHPNWEAIKPIAPAEAMKRANKAPLIDLWRYNESKLADWLTFLEKTARAYDPKFRLGMSGTRPSLGYNAYDYWRLQNASKAIVNYGGPMPRESWSFAGREHYLGKWEGYGSNYRETAGDIVWNSLAADLSSIQIYATFPDFGPFWPDFTIAPGAAGIRDAYAEVSRGISTLLKGAKRERDPIAIHYSQVSAHMASLRAIPGLDPDQFNGNLTSLERLLADLGYQSRYVSYEEIENGVLEKEKFRAFIMPLSTAISDKEAAQIKAFAESGGVVIADAIPGLFDAHGRARERGTLDNLFGVTRQERKLARLGRVLEPSADASQRFLTGPAKFMQGEATLRADGAKATAAYPESAPALLVKEVGKGKAVFMNLLLADYSVFRSGGVGGEVGTVAVARAERQRLAQQLLQSLLGVANLKPVVRVENPTPAGKPVLNTEIIRYDDRDASYVMIHVPRMRANLLAERATNAVTVHLPVASHVYDVRTGQFHGKVAKLSATLTEIEPLIFAMLPQKAGALSVRLSGDAFAPGGIVTAKVSSDGSGKPYRRVYHVEVFGPDGKIRRVHTTNVEASTGAAEFSIPLALNDVPGKWIVRVKDAATGARGEIGFQVKGKPGVAASTVASTPM